jgi:hypothetical protein
MDKYVDYDYFLFPKELLPSSIHDMLGSYPEFAIRDRVLHMSFFFDDMSFSQRRAKIPGFKSQPNQDLISVLECQCGKTNWQFTQSNRKHIKNRKAIKKISLNNVSFVKNR